MNPSCNKRMFNEIPCLWRKVSDALPDSTKTAGDFSGCIYKKDMFL